MQAGQITDLCHTCEGVHAEGGGPAAVTISHEACEAADAVAAHLRLGAVAVVHAHGQVYLAACPVWCHGKDHLHEQHTLAL